MATVMTTAVPLTAREAEVFRKIADPDGWSIEARDGTVTLVTAHLPGRLVTSVVRQGPMLWILVDLTKRQSYEELIVTMASWENCAENRWAAVTFPVTQDHTLAEFERLMTAGVYDGRCVIGGLSDQDPWTHDGHTS